MRNLAVIAALLCACVPALAETNSVTTLADWHDAQLRALDSLAAPAIATNQAGGYTVTLPGSGIAMFRGELVCAFVSSGSPVPLAKAALAMSPDGVLGGPVEFDRRYLKGPGGMTEAELAGRLGEASLKLADPWELHARILLSLAANGEGYYSVLNLFKAGDVDVLMADAVFYTPLVFSLECYRSPALNGLWKGNLVPSLYFSLETHFALAPVVSSLLFAGYATFTPGAGLVWRPVVKDRATGEWTYSPNKYKVYLACMLSVPAKINTTLDLAAEAEFGRFVVQLHGGLALGADRDALDGFPLFYRLAAGVRLD